MEYIYVKTNKSLHTFVTQHSDLNNNKSKNCCDSSNDSNYNYNHCYYASASTSTSQKPNNSCYIVIIQWLVF